MEVPPYFQLIIAHLITAEQESQIQPVWVYEADFRSDFERHNMPAILLFEYILLFYLSAINVDTKFNTSAA